MNTKINRLLSAYYDAVRHGEKRRASIIYRQLYDLGIVLIPEHF